MLDEKLDKKMFRPDVKKMETRMSCAAIEACKAKKLYGALRALWRSSNVNGADARITHLKSFVAPSPKRDEVEGEGETERPDESHPAVVPLAPLRDASESDDVGSGGESDDEDVSTREEPCEIEPSQPSPNDSSESGDHRDSPTLELGSPDSDREQLEPCALVADGDGVYSPKSSFSVESSDSEPKDSQVPGAGWMGKAMMASRFLEKEEKAKQEREEEITKFLGYVRQGLNFSSLGNDDDVNGCWGDYSAYCYGALKQYGQSVIPKLSDMDFFRKWLHNFKSGCAQDWFDVKSKYLFNTCLFCICFKFISFRTASHKLIFSLLRRSIALKLMMMMMLAMRINLR